MCAVLTCGNAKTLIVSIGTIVCDEGIRSVAIKRCLKLVVV